MLIAPESCGPGTPALEGKDLVVNRRAKAQACREQLELKAEVLVSRGLLVRRVAQSKGAAKWSTAELDIGLQKQRRLLRSSRPRVAKS